MASSDEQPDTNPANAIGRAKPTSLELWQLMKWNPRLWLALGFGSGLSKYMPGTAGTLAGAALFVPLMMLSPMATLILLVLGLLCGPHLCQYASEKIGMHDSGSIVIDEIVAIGWVIFLLPQIDWYWLVAAFVTFRFFDIVKPPPIAWLDKHVQNGNGIMVDDYMAAGYTLLILLIADIFL